MPCTSDMESDADPEQPVVALEPSESGYAAAHAAAEPDLDHGAGHDHGSGEVACGSLVLDGWWWCPDGDAGGNESNGGANAGVDDDRQAVPTAGAEAPGAHACLSGAPIHTDGDAGRR